jgi:hypothetical protein
MKRELSVSVEPCAISRLNSKAGQGRTVRHRKKPELNPSFEPRAAGFLFLTFDTGGPLHSR